MAKLYDIHPKTLSHYHMNIVSDFAKDKKDNWWEWSFEGISKRWRSNENHMGKKLCIDDKNLQWEWVIILSNPEKNKPVAIIAWTQAKQAIDYIKTYIPKEKRDKVAEVSLDMWRNMEQIVRECFPNAILVTDRFHVMKNVLEDLLAIRTRCKTAIKKKILDEEKAAKERWEKYKPTRYMTWETEIEVVTRLIRQIRKRRSSWNRSQQRRRILAWQIEELSEVIIAYSQVERLWWIYDSFVSKQVAENSLKKRISDWDEIWLEILEISNTTRMFRRRLDSITNYFVHRHTNGYAEWLNSRIQRLISMTRWFANRDYLYYRIIKMFG